MGINVRMNIYGGQRTILWSEYSFELLSSGLCGNCLYSLRNFS